MNPEEDQPVAGPSHRNDNQDEEDEPMPLEFQPHRRLSPAQLFTSDIPRRRSSAPTHQNSPEYGRREPLEQQMRHMQALYLEQPQHHLRQPNQHLPPDYYLPEIPPSRAYLELLQQQQQMHELHQQQLQQQEQRHQHQQHQQLQQQKHLQQLQEQQQQLQQQQSKTPQESDNQQLAPSNDDNGKDESMPPPPYPQPEQQQQEQGPQEQPQQQQQQAKGQQADAEASTSGAGGEAPTTPSKRHINMVTLCGMAQHTVQEIVVRFQEVTGILRHIAPPNGRLANEMYAAEQKRRLIENVKIITFLFKRLRGINDRCNEESQDVQGLNYIDVGSLAPMKEDPKDGKFEDRKANDEYRKAEEVRNHLLRHVIVKNRTLKDLINRVRRITSEINTMMGSRRDDTSDDRYT